MALMSVATAVASNGWCGLLLEAVLLTSLASGRPWARWICVVFSVFELAFIGGVLATFRDRLPPIATPALILFATTDLFWLYVLFHRDTVRYFRTDQ